MIKIDSLLKSLIIFCMVLGVAEAKTATMQWFLQPNKTMGKTISAISDYFSAKCVTDIQSGKLILNINGQTRVLDPYKNSAIFSRVNGNLISGSQKYSYAYSILWIPKARQANPANLVCTGDNHRTD